MCVTGTRHINIIFNLFIWNSIIDKKNNNSNKPFLLERQAFLFVCMLYFCWFSRTWRLRCTFRFTETFRCFLCLSQARKAVINNCRLEIDNEYCPLRFTLKKSIQKLWCDEKESDKFSVILIYIVEVVRQKLHWLLVWCNDCSAWENIFFRFCIAMLLFLLLLLFAHQCADTQSKRRFCRFNNAIYAYIHWLDKNTKHVQCWWL